LSGRDIGDRRRDVDDSHNDRIEIGGQPPSTGHSGQAQYQSVTYGDNIATVWIENAGSELTIKEGNSGEIVVRMSGGPGGPRPKRPIARVAPRTKDPIGTAVSHVKQLGGDVSRESKNAFSQAAEGGGRIAENVGIRW
jgi:hypothetical protein